MKRLRHWKGQFFVAGNGYALGHVLPVNRPTAFGDVLWNHFKSKTTGRARSMDEARRKVEALCKGK